jgi:mRNA interferase MazF
VKRGEIRWYTFKSPDKRRPVVVLTRNSSISVLNTVTVAPITTTIRNVKSEVFLGRNDGLKDDCAINLHNLQTVSKDQLGSIISTLSQKHMKEIEISIQFALGFGDVV